jgi:hypothetical protein
MVVFPQAVSSNRYRKARPRRSKLGSGRITSGTKLSNLNLSLRRQRRSRRDTRRVFRRTPRHARHQAKGVPNCLVSDAASLGGMTTRQTDWQDRFNPLPRHGKGNTTLPRMKIQTHRAALGDYRTQTGSNRHMIKLRQSPNCSMMTLHSILMPFVMPCNDDNAKKIDFYLFHFISRRPNAKITKPRRPYSGRYRIPEQKDAEKFSKP